jgi:antitoxin component YwqK of YwqJK toxin-antitoxin module
MRFLLILIVFGAFSINTISQQKLSNNSFTGLLKDTDKNGKVIKETLYKDGKKNGIEKEYFETGNLKKLVTYSRGKKNGLSEEFGGFGAKLESIKTYKNDSLNKRAVKRIL